MHGERDPVRLGDSHPAVGQRAQELFSLSLEGRNRVDDARDGLGIDRIFEHEKPPLVERPRLLVRDQTKRSRAPAST